MFRIIQGTVRHFWLLDGTVVVGKLTIEDTNHTPKAKALDIVRMRFMAAMATDKWKDTYQVREIGCGGCNETE